MAEGFPRPLFDVVTSSCAQMSHPDVTTGKLPRAALAEDAQRC